MTSACEPWPVTVRVIDTETGAEHDEVQIRCGCLDSLALDYGHELTVTY